YFPIKKEGSVFGKTGVKTSAASQAWKGEVAPGVYGVQFRAEGKKIFADSPEGWIAYVDEREGYAYFKVFEIWEGADYPDDGARNEVWINNNPAYVEVEVVSPIWPIAPGGKITFIEDWYAARMFGPVLTANHAGAIRKRLAYRDESSTLTATYGVFHEGSARIVFLDDNNGLLAEGKSYDVTPMQEFIVDESLSAPAGAASAEVRVFDKSGELVGALESKPVDQLTSIAAKAMQPSFFSLAQNYPNPFNASTAIEYTVARAQRVSLTIFAMDGREVALLADDVAAPGTHRVVWHAGSAAAGIYVARLEGEGRSATTKMILLK
ncbi:T9SS type A sorting domain-containing protein, partial [candidate division KSB1 bacterium]|nr:T9SS type A sorting domain-containing protein [candidate division KSB1 bacterium]